MNQLTCRCSGANCRLGIDDPRHGTINGYLNLECRCMPCQQANITWCHEQKLKRTKRGLPPGDDRHGTANGYGNWGCRCRLCTDAWAVDRTNRRHRHNLT